MKLRLSMGMSLMACALWAATLARATQAAPEMAASAPPTPTPTVPLYQAELPAASTLHYQLRKGWITGEGELRWAPTAKRYELSLQGSVSGMRLLAQTSSGAWDAHGLVPLRFSDQRARGAAQVATFQREAGSISFSGLPDAAPWAPGAQDRLSWMVQLPAVVRAQPQRQDAGQVVELYVAGARGDADVWTFRFVGQEEVTTASGAVLAGKWVREPRKPRDTTVEVWLDPHRQHLPVRARLGVSGNDNDALELLLQHSSSP